MFLFLKNLISKITHASQKKQDHILFNEKSVNDGKYVLESALEKLGDDKIIAFCSFGGKDLGVRPQEFDVETMLKVIECKDIDWEKINFNKFKFIMIYNN